MRFKRIDRFDYSGLSVKKVAAMKHRQARERAKYPLFSDQIAEQQAPIDISAEERHRRAMFEKDQQESRGMHARFWRKARSQYFAATPEQREAIRAEWNRWAGPLDSGYFIYVVEKHTGEADRRVAEMKARDQLIVQQVWHDMRRQQNLILDGVTP